jgi:ADP-ribosylglycohydrolase
MGCIHGLITGIAIGDALGVPVEYMHRSFLKDKPVTDMRAFGTHHQAAGTWSDDTALSYCLVEQLIEGYDLGQLANKIVDWYEKGYWTATGQIFDLGVTTRQAIDRLQRGILPQLSGQKGEYANGNGSLMRMLPLCVFALDKTIDERWDLVDEISSITHQNIRPKIACFFLVEMAINLCKGYDKCDAFVLTQNTVRDFVNTKECSAREQEVFLRLFYDDLSQFPDHEIFSSGYVIHTLEAGLWVFLTTNSFEEAVLKAVNLGDDTDTTGSIVGALAGLFYGIGGIPQPWITTLARHDDIQDLAQRFKVAMG